MATLRWFGRDRGTRQLSARRHPEVKDIWAIRVRLQIQARIGISRCSTWALIVSFGVRSREAPRP